MPNRRTLKRIKNRLAKRGLTLLRVEQGDRDLITYRLILETKGTPRLGRAFAYPINWMKSAPGRVIADAVLADYIKGYGYVPRSH